MHAHWLKSASAGHYQAFLAVVFTSLYPALRLGCGCHGSRQMHWHAAIVGVRMSLHIDQWAL